MTDRFARGRSAEVFRIDDGRVMKLFFADYPREYAEKEFRNTKIASELGCTPMKVYEMVEKEGRCGFIMDFINGVCTLFGVIGIFTAGSGDGGFVLHIIHWHSLLDSTSGAITNKRCY